MAFTGTRDADGAVDALVWVDDQEVRAFAKAVDGADVYTISEAAFDAGFCDDVCHGDVMCPKGIILDRIVVHVAWNSHAPHEQSRKGSQPRTHLAGPIWACL